MAGGTAAINTMECNEERLEPRATYGTHAVLFVTFKSSRMLLWVLERLELDVSKDINDGPHIRQLSHKIIL
jgi:hypothetical protein